MPILRAAVAAGVDYLVNNERIRHLPVEDRVILDEQLTQLAERQGSQNSKELPRCPLRGSVVRFDEPTEPVADND